MLRTLALSLLAANVLLFAWTQGWLGTFAPSPPALQGREPERLQQQVRPEALTVLRPRAVAASPNDPGGDKPADASTPARPGASSAAPTADTARPQR